MRARLAVLLVALLAPAVAGAATPRPLPAPGVHRHVTVLPSDVVCVGADGGTRLVCYARARRAAESRARRDLIRTAAHP
jgi:hypothetical protein